MSNQQTSDFVADTLKTFDELFAEVFGEPKPTAPAEQDPQPCE